MAFYTVATKTITVNREDGTTRDITVDIEQDLGADPGAGTLPIVEDIILTQGDSGDDYDKEIKVTRCEIRLTGDVSTFDVLDDLIAGGPNDFRLRVTDDTNSHEFFYGPILPELSGERLHEDVQSFTVSAYDGIAGATNTLATLATTRTIDEIITEFNAALGISRDATVITSMRENRQAAADDIPNELRYPAGFASVPDIAGIDGGDGLTNYDRLRGLCRALGARAFISSGRLFISELYEQSVNAATANRYQESSGTYTQGTVDKRVTVAQADQIQGSTGVQENYVKQTIWHTRYHDRVAFDITEADGGAVTALNLTESYTQNNIVKTGDVITALNNIGWDEVYAGTVTNDQYDFLGIKVTNEIGPDYWWDGNTSTPGWTTTETYYTKTFGSLAAGTQSIVLPGFALPEIPAGVLGELSVELRYDAGFDANLTSIEITDLQIRTTKADDDTVIYNRATVTAADTTTGRQIAKVITVGDADGYSIQISPEYDTTGAGDFADTATWYDAGGADTLITILARRMATVINGQKSMYEFQIRDTDAYVDLSNSFVLNNTTSTTNWNRTVIPRKITHRILEGFYLIEAWNYTSDTAAETEARTPTLAKTTQGGASNAGDVSSDPAGAGGGVGGGSVTLGSLGLSEELTDLTNAEVQQLQNIDSVTISNAQWQYLGSLDQDLSATDSPTFAGLTLTGALTGTSATFSGDVTGANLSPSVWDSTTLTVGIKEADWDAAYGWGDHALAGYLTSFTETDPVFTASPAFDITNADLITYDNTAFTVSAGESDWNTGFATGLAGATLTGTTLNLQRNTASQISVDLAAINTDTNNYVSSLSWAPTTGVLTLNRSGLSALAIDLDGRYLTTESDPVFTASPAGGITANDINVWDVTALNVANNEANWDTGFATGAAALGTSGTSLTLSRNTASQLTVNLDSFVKNIANKTYIDGLGVDADTVDGLSSGAFFRSNASNAVDARFSASNGRGVRFWDNDNYKIYMSASGDGTWGGRVTGETTSDYNMYFKMTAGTNRGFVFKSGTTNVAGIDSTGKIYTQNHRTSAEWEAAFESYILSGSFSSGTLMLTRNISGSPISISIGSYYALASHNHSASQITSGTFANARISASSVTQHITKSYIDGLNINANTLGGLSSGAFARAGARTDNYVWVRRSSTGSTLYVTQQNSGGDIARFYAGSGDGTMRVRIKYNGSIVGTHGSENTPFWDFRNSSGDGLMLGTNADGDPYFAPITANGIDFNDEFYYDISANYWVFESNLYAEDFILSSDRRLKENIQDFKAMSIINQLQPKSYAKNNRHQYGFIAQDVLNVLPDTVNYNVDDDVYTMSYNDIIGINTQAIKEVDDEVTRLKKKVKNQDKRIKELEDMLAA